MKDMNSEPSHELLSLWLNRIKMPTDALRQTMIDEHELDSTISDRSFNHWFTKSRVSGKTDEEIGQRVTAVVEAIAKFRDRFKHKDIILTDELEAFIGLYPAIPAQYRLQLRRLLHELSKEQGQHYGDRFLSKPWREQFESGKIFGYVIDPLSCIRAYSRYAMDFAGLKEEDAKHWYWWHRLAIGKRGKSGNNKEDTLFALRGVYAEEYYTQQMLRFIYTAEEYELLGTDRYNKLLELLRKIDTTYVFARLWDQAERMYHDKVELFPQIPVPFFRSDQTFTWMLEVSAPIAKTDLLLTARLPTDEVEAEYLADFRRETDEKNKGKKPLFIEDFAKYFEPEERFALGLPEK